MEFSNKLREYSKRAEMLKESIITTEEATKTSLVMPFFNILGYDVFNPLEFFPEYVADVGIKKGEKVDYAILKSGKPEILIECKNYTEDLDKHVSQLYRYFGTSEAKFGILTNGLIYRFYTDLDEVNKMDLVPFLEIDITDLKDSDIVELKKFTKEDYNKKKILNSAEEMKYESAIRGVLEREFEEPSNEFVRFVLGDACKGLEDDRVASNYSPVVKRVLMSFVTEMVLGRVTSAMEKDTKKVEKKVKLEKSEEVKDVVYSYEGKGEFSNIFETILTEVLSWEDVTRKDVEGYIGLYVKKKKFVEASVSKAKCEYLLGGVLAEDFEATKEFIQIDGAEGLEGRKVPAFWSLRDDFKVTDKAQIPYIISLLRKSYENVVSGVVLTEEKLAVYNEVKELFPEEDIAYYDNYYSFDIILGCNKDRVLCSFVSDKGTLKVLKDGKWKAVKYSKDALLKYKDAIAAVIGNK